MLVNFYEQKILIVEQKCPVHPVTHADKQTNRKAVADLLNPMQFGPQKPSIPKAPGNIKSGRNGRYLPPIKTREELDLIEARARALNAKTNRYQTGL